ncbi:VanZ family protein [Paenibacillus beijingensis]|uniref:VanZ-like domain-containing protein n=1 Tax=Paenibacillus beijingensis TaxID=1126833 RepID=A0A0D5NER4_9BACL|nr:VanZ family protein [Paenibacillus beijingensis]AJY73472.1 hypothetical protein VN24_01080 [Paenibacillus beijingensis]
MKLKTRILLAMSWTSILFIFTCTVSLSMLLKHQYIHFNFNPDPHFRQFFRLMDINKIHDEWIVVKLGHFIGFAIMDVLLFNMVRRKNTALLLSILFAIVTEIFQLYFHRDGRLYDVLIDSSGALISYLLLSDRAFDKEIDTTR